MFRAITDYFFGGAPEEPQSPLETQEVNDWLVVNMADQPHDDLVMIESPKPDPMSDSEYEDILDAVSCLMRAVEEPPAPELEPSDGESTVESSDSEEAEEEEVEEEEEEEIAPKETKRYINDTKKKNESEIFLEDPCAAFFSLSRKVWEEEYTANMRLMLLKVYEKQMEHNRRLQQNICLLYRECLIREQEVVQHFETVPVDNRMKPYPEFNCKDIAYAEELMEKSEDEYDLTSTVELLQPEIRIVQCSPEQERPNKFVLPRRYARMYLHVLNASSKDYSSLRKAEIQQRIHEVEREQKLKKYKTEKVINKGQLNRQNKNYLFQSSCKKNQRRDLQRSHSGANNNRKCSC